MAQKFKGNVNVEGNLNLPNTTANRVLVSDVSKNITPSTVTDTELSRLSGITSNVQDQLDDKIDLTEKGANNGVATLDAGGKIPATQLPNSVMEYLGNWNATTNSPTLADGVGNNGDVYRVNVAGTQNLGSGSISFNIGDFVIYNGTIWEKSVNSNDVVSVNGQQGVVVLDTDDIAEGSNQYFTNERAQDAVGTILQDTFSIDLNYNDTTNEISATVLPAGVDHDQLQNFVANEHIDHSSVEIQTQSNSGLSGGGNITTTRSLVVDIIGTTEETSADNSDSILIYDNSATARRRMSRGNFLSGLSLASVGDINEASFSGANNQTTFANVTGFNFSTTTVRGFSALVTVTLNATTDLFETFTFTGTNVNGSFVMEQSSVGDTTGVVFDITSSGQIRYTSPNSGGFVSLTIKFRAQVLGV